MAKNRGFLATRKKFLFEKNFFSTFFDSSLYMKLIIQYISEHKSYGLEADQGCLNFGQIACRPPYGVGVPRQNQRFFLVLASLAPAGGISPRRATTEESLIQRLEKPANVVGIIGPPKLGYINQV